MDVKQGVLCYQHTHHAVLSLAITILIIIYFNRPGRNIASSSGAMRGLHLAAEVTARPTVITFTTRALMVDTFDGIRNLRWPFCAGPFFFVK